MKAIHDLGRRLDVYADITAPVLLLQGERSPAHLGERIRSLARVLPDDEVVEFDGQGHAGNKRAPDKLAVLVADFYDRIVSDSR